MVVLAPQKFALLFTLGRGLGILGAYAYLVIYCIRHGNSYESYSRQPNIVEALCASLAAFQLFEDILLS